MKNDKIKIRGARVHNLKNIDLDIPRDKFVVITGISGSGKSSLAFDTLYAEGRRRYVESLSTYARQFLGQMDKPDVDLIEGLSPSIAIDQKTTNRNPRSTVGTVTEIYDYMRLMYARLGTCHCHICGREINGMSVDEIVSSILEMEEGTKIQVLAPLEKGSKGTHKKLIENLIKEGYIRARIDGEITELSSDIELDKNKKHNIDVVIDRLVIKEGIMTRLSDSVELALKLTGSLVTINVLDGEDHVFSTSFSCPEHGTGLQELEPRIFSFNAPYGACEECKGLGEKLSVDQNLIISDENLSFNEGAFSVYSSASEDSYYAAIIGSLLDEYELNLDTKYCDYPEELKDKILYGTGRESISFQFKSQFSKRTKRVNRSFEGIINNLERRYMETSSQYIKEWIEKFMMTRPCEKCKGNRLKDEVLAVTIGGLSIIDMTQLSIIKLKDFTLGLSFDGSKTEIARPIIKEIVSRLEFLENVGLGYLNLARAAGTLSGGESQRIRLATQIGSALCGVLYILDEPSIGLHQKDNDMLLNTLRKLTDIGNSLLVVEHDEDTMRFCDYIIDMGPEAGERGGHVVAEGPLKDIIRNKDSITGKYLSGELKIEVPETRRKADGRYIEVKGAAENNLKGVDCKFPIGLFTCVTGVSGSGKSSLVNEVLYKSLVAKLSNSKKMRTGKHEEISGTEHIDKIIEIDQSPIGRTPRSNPATYTKIFDKIRDIFSELPSAKQRGYQKGRFSFNVKGGRCEACSGDGLVRVEMHFLPDIYVPCDVCKGRRYNRETLEVKYKGKNISDVLNMTVAEAIEFFDVHTSLKAKLQTLIDVGLDYIKLGQSSTELSGGEAQRIKLAAELSKKSTGRTLYILDEPTTGLHTADVHKLIKVLQRLTDEGNSIVVIEHNLDVIKSADYLIDLGPEGGDRGGNIIAEGSPEDLVKNYSHISYTAKYLKKLL